MKKQNYIKLLLLILITTVGFSQTAIEEKAEKNRNLEGIDNEVVIKSTVKPEVGGTDTKLWTAKDWQKNNGADSSKIGHSQMIGGTLPGGNVAASANPNQLTADAVSQNPLLNTTPSMTAFSDESLNKLIASSTSSDVTGELFDQTVRCYITRDIAIKYKCSHTQLTYGDNINGDGFKAKNQCEDECYEQFESVEIVAEGTLPSKTISNIEIITPTTEQLTTDLLETDPFKNETNELLKNKMKENYLKKEVESAIIVDDIHVLTKLTFKVVMNDIVPEDPEAPIDEETVKVIKDNTSFITMKYLDSNGNEITIFKDYKLNKTGYYEFSINEVVTKVSLEAKTITTDVILKIEDIELNYEGGEYICPHVQDISNKKAGNFAYICPSGKINNISFGYKNYQICQDYGSVGDNLNGTYSRQETANTICKKKYGCSMDMNLVNTTVLQNFREGCIQGQTDCSTDLCKKLRIEGNAILNENVFDGSSQPTVTISNQAQVQGVQRPRVLLSEDLSFQERTAEELKDEAYKNMLDSQTFKVAKFDIDENTERSSAYSIGVSMEGNNYAGSAKRALYWVLKPSAYDMVYTQKFYSIFDVVVKRNVRVESGRIEPVKDRILYLKTNAVNDYLKPFARKVNWAKDVLVTDDDGITDVQHFEEETATWKYESFDVSTNRWYSHSSSMTAEYFKSEKINLNDKPFIRIKVMSDVGNLVYAFPGVVKSLSINGPYETKIFTGKFDGTGESIVKVTNYNILMNSTEPSLVYRRIVEMIENQEIEPTYDSLRFGTMANTVKNDMGEVGGDIQLYMYGEKQSKTGYTRIFPKTKDVGRNGFIYIFAVDEE